jgi:hypothetical protein
MTAITAIVAIIAVALLSPGGPVILAQRRQALMTQDAQLTTSSSSDWPLSFNGVVQERILPQAAALLRQLVKEKRKLTIDGVPVFNGSDKFLPGKIAIALVEYLVTLPKDDPRLPELLKDFREVARLTVDDANDSWGAYYYMLALDKLRGAGLVDQALDRLTFAKLRVRLDWRMFVNPETHELIADPNNYYVVALAIARLRHQMGWEDETGSDALYAKVAEHYRKYSGDFGFADETEGDGRFDRYSVLLAGELVNHFIETGGRVPDEALTWLRKSADVMLTRLHADGAGFEYGRSLGPYSETAIIEVLTAAARTGLLTQDERALAYAYASRAAQRYVDFWVRNGTGSVNLWDDGRRTDAYRGKFRILGENLSLAHQFVYTNEAWNAMGFKGKPAMADFGAALDRLPAQTVTWFAKGAYDRLLITRRDAGHVIGLPLINGGAGQHMHHPYFPIPFSRGMLEGVPDGDAPALVPQFTLKDGAVLMPLAFTRDAAVEVRGRATILTYRQSEMDRMGGSVPVRDDRLAVATTYTLEPNRITRKDVFVAKQPLDVAGVRMEFAGFSTGPKTSGTTTVFGNGTVTSFQVSGLNTCQARSLDRDHDYESDTGAMTSLVVCWSGPSTINGPQTIAWSMSYR